MCDETIDNLRRLQPERNDASAGKKGSKTFDPSSQRTDVSTKTSLTESFNTTLYGRDGDTFVGYNTSIAVAEDEEDEEMVDGDTSRRLAGQYTVTKAQMDEFARGDGVEEERILLGKEKSARIADREGNYQKRRLDCVPFPTKSDAFVLTRPSGAADEGESYREFMKRRELEREEERVRWAVAEKEATGEVVHHKATLLESGDRSPSDKENKKAVSTEVVAAGRKRKQRWDISSESTAEKEAAVPSETKAKRSRWDQRLQLELYRSKRHLGCDLDGIRHLLQCLLAIKVSLLQCIHLKAAL